METDVEKRYCTLLLSDLMPCNPKAHTAQLSARTESQQAYELHCGQFESECSVGDFSFRVSCSHMIQNQAHVNVVDNNRILMTITIPRQCLDIGGFTTVKRIEVSNFDSLSSSVLLQTICFAI
jgi:hypothetical protein